MVQVHRTSSNLLEPHHCRDTKVCRVHPHEFGVVRLYRTFSGETMSAGCLCTSSGWFKRIEPPRTFSNHIIAEIVRCVEFIHMSSGWFDCAEQGMQGVMHLFGVVPVFSNHIITESKVCRVLSHEFGVVRPYRTFSIYIVTGETRSAGCLCTSSGLFKHIEPPRTFSNHFRDTIACSVLSHEFRVVRLY